MIESPYGVYETKSGTKYLKSPGVALISQPSVELHEIQSFLLGFKTDFRKV